MNATQAITIRAFNLVPGAVILLPSGEAEPIVWVDRDPNLETVFIRFRNRPSDWFDYNHEVQLVGLSVNPDADDDVDFGANAHLPVVVS